MATCLVWTASRSDRLLGVLEGNCPRKIPGLSQPACQSHRSINEKLTHYFPAVTQPIGSSQQIESWSGIIGTSVGWLLYQASPREQINHCEVVIRGCLHHDYCLISDQRGCLNFSCISPPTLNLRIKIFVLNIKTETNK